MWSLVAGLASSASGILALLAVCAGLTGLCAFEQHKIDESKLLRLEQIYKDAQMKAAADAATRQLEIDQAALAAVSAEAQAQAMQAATLQQELTYARAHATTIIQRIAPTCVPWGAVRILYAGSHGIPADSLVVPAGQLDSACSPIGWFDLAAAILHDYGQASKNAARLDALTAMLRKQQAVLQEKK